MFALKDKDNLIVDVSSTQPTVSVEGILFNSCFYQTSFELAVVENVPDYVKPQRFKVEIDGVTFTPLLDNLDPYEITLVNASRDAKVVEMQTTQSQVVLALVMGGLM